MARGTARWQTLPPHGSRIGNLPELRIPHANAVRRHEVPNCYRSHPWSRSWQAGDSQFWPNQISDRLWGRQVTICHKFFWRWTPVGISGKAGNVPLVRRP